VPGETAAADLAALIESVEALDLWKKGGVEPARSSPAAAISRSETKRSCQGWLAGTRVETLSQNISLPVRPATIRP
jgi:hypothetical protein